ncbi:hypothetical protein AB0I53_10570 [Saccharopolyspora sp. NPDC050389]|uniref:hypothetical protein n=1 Tax=Saccharopolyspora sp. NPDC050389 TaxID=3155516 RepID=UPI0033E694FE
MSRKMLILPVVAGLLVGAVFFGALVFVGPSITLREKVLHEESSEASGVTYEYSGSQWASELYLVRVSRLTGTQYELRIGPGAADHYYPVQLRFGSGEPRIRSVEWRPDEVAVTLDSGDSVHVPADNFRSVR